MMDTWIWIVLALLTVAGIVIAIRAWRRHRNVDQVDDEGAEDVPGDAWDVVGQMVAFNRQLEKVVGELNEAKRSRRRDRFFMGIGLALFIGVGYGLHANHDTAEAANHAASQAADAADEAKAAAAAVRTATRAACKSGNRRVAGNRAWFNNFFDLEDASAQAGGSPQPVVTFFKRWREWTIEDTQPFRDCHHLNKPIPMPGPPPSFDKALQAAADQQGQG